MSDPFRIGVTALVANQTALSTVGHNISNINTKGYSRQEANFSANSPFKSGSGFLGTGVGVEGVRRIVNQFVTENVRVTGNNLSRVSIVYDQVSQIDNLLGNEQTGLSPSLARFFGAMHSAAEDPTSISHRQMVLSEGNLLVSRINAIYNQFESQNESLNTQLETITTQINTLSAGIADLNERVASAGSGGISSAPNDLLDKRDQLIHEISELVSVTVVENSDSSVNLYVGNGQGIVVSNRSFRLGTEIGSADASRHDISYATDNNTQVITNSISGGKLGGLLYYRSDILDQVYNQLGLVTLGLQSSINEQHQQGMDLDGEIGGVFFSDINSDENTRTRVVADSDNAEANDQDISLEISDIGLLTTDDYVMEFSSTDATRYSIRRQRDDTLVGSGVLSGVFPSTIEFDGLSLSINAGTFSTSDTFTLYPTRFASNFIEMSVENVRDFALAQPVRTRINEGNLGTGQISQGQTLDTSTDAFSDSGRGLNPPLVIQFTSATTYNVLDNTDPNHPIDLVPPMRDRIFTPGASNKVFEEDEDVRSVTSAGNDIALLQNTNGTNGYSAETYEFTYYNEETGVITTQNVSTIANSTAASIASSIDALDGVSASARNYAQITNINSVSPMTLTLNGQLLSGTTPDQIASSINSNVVLQDFGVSALSDGGVVTLRASTGVDFVFEVGGASVGDTIEITNIHGDTLSVNALSAIPAVTLGGQVFVELEKGVSMTGDGEVFDNLPTHTPLFRGYQVVLSGHPADDDLFYVEFNTNGFSDNRNVLKIAEIQNAKLMNGNEATIDDIYNSLVNAMGTKTNEAEISKEAADVLFDRAKQERDEASGVNLDEEAANLMRFEQAYNAAAQLVSVAKSLFEALLSTVR